jgi:membrane fusion protein, multidrug efflux system
MKNRRSIVAAFFMVSILSGCGGPSNTAPVEFRIPVEVTDITTADVEDLIVTTGTLRTRENVALTVETPGYLKLSSDANGNRLTEGSNVQANQLIAEIIGEDARLASNLEASKQHLERSQQELERRQQLFKQKLISEEDVWNARTQYEDRLHAYDTSQRTLEKARIVTPIAGVILQLARDANGQAVADGQKVNAGFDIARVAPLDTLIADIDLVGPELSRVTPGQSVRIKHYAFEGKELSGTILRLSPTLDPTTRTFRVEVEVNNDERLLRPGMFVQAAIIAERREAVVVAPREAITKRGGRNVVFVVDGQRVVQRQVGLGLADDERFEISEGLQVGERIAIRGLETLTDNTRVRVVTP